MYLVELILNGVKDPYNRSMDNQLICLVKSCSHLGIVQ